MTAVNWREITRSEFIIILRILMVAYKLAKKTDIDSETKMYYEDTGQELITHERIFLYRQYSWVDAPNRFFVNEAVVSE